MVNYNIDDALSKKLRCVGFLSIVLVVMIHANTRSSYPDRAGLGSSHLPPLSYLVQEVIGNGVARIAVPLFFALSGFLFFASYAPSARVVLTKYRKRARSLLVPYLLWSLLIIILVAAIQITLVPKDSPRSAGHIMNLSAPKLLDLWLLKPIPFQLWFLRDLMLLALLSPLLFYAVRWAGYVWLPAMFIVWLCDFDVWPLAGRAPVLSIDGAFWYNFGAAVAIRRVRLASPVRFAGALLVLWVALVLARTWHDPTFNSWRTRDFDSLGLLLHKASIIAGVAAIWTAYDRWLRPLKLAWLQAAAQYTFFVYAAHEPLLGWVAIGLPRLLGKEEWAKLCAYVLGPTVVVLGAIVIAHVLKKRANRVYLVLTGGR